MTKEKLADIWIMDLNQNEFLSDLNEVIRQELIMFLAWYGTCEIDVTKTVVNNYLKSKEK